MNNAFQNYSYKGWSIKASEAYNDWGCFLNFKNDEDCSKYEEFCDNEEIRFKTMKEAKNWINSDEAKEIKKRYNVE